MSWSCKLFGALNEFNPVVCGGIRSASKKAGGGIKYQNTRPKPKYRGPIKHDGDLVTSGTMLVNQTTLRFHPGLNVGIGSPAILFALETGRVKVSGDPFNPHWDHPRVKKHYEGQPIPRYKKYYHVIPELQQQAFRLVRQI